MIWLDGAIFPDSHAPFDLSDRGLLLGDGAFDTALVMNGRVFQEDAHLRRLLDTLAAIGITADPDAIRAAAAALIPGAERHILRVTVTRGPGLRGLAPHGTQHPTVLASLTPLPPNYFFPRLSLDIAATRRNETSPTSRLKTLAYLDGILAMREAVAKHHSEVLFLNCAGKVACAAAANIFALFGQEICTPPLSDGVLPGIIRGFILTHCGELNLRSRERSLDLDELRGADAVFLSNSLRLVAPVERIGDHAIKTAGAETMKALQGLLWRAIATECGIDAN